MSQLTRLPDGELVHVDGLYSRHLDGAVLTQGEQRLLLIGDPFTYLPTQGASVEAWGRLLQGPVRRLHLHDARPAGTASPVPETSETAHAGDDITINIRNAYIGDDQIATTADRRSYFLVGEELAQRHYVLVGRILTLSPPTLQVTRAVPVVFSPTR